MKLGRNLARTFLDYYKLQNYIVFNPSTSIMPKLNSSTGFSTYRSASLLGNGNGNSSLLGLVYLIFFSNKFKFNSS